jgi:16S rRNA G966 N2-methylase RsmD
MEAHIFDTFDFTLLDTVTFKEDSVREDIISPLLYNLEYSTGGLNRIIRSRSLRHPFVNIGSQSRKVNLVPDYLLTVNSKAAWILDAKAPYEHIESGSHVEQAYSYAIHPEVRAKYFALCNGREFIVFQIDVEAPVLYFQMSEIPLHWERLYALLAPSAFKLAAPIIPFPAVKPDARSTDFYANIKPLPEIKELKKQSAHRHYGVHPYFTKQVWNVVQEYIKNFSQPGDRVLDPFGGSGVTAIEALVLGRRGIHIDLNPLAIFLVEKLVAPVNLSDFSDAFEYIKQQFNKNAPRTDAAIQKALARYHYPQGVRLPRNSDVDTVDQLFSPEQLAQLAYLKHLIRQVKDQNIQGTLLLMFSGLLNKVNLTYHASSGRSAGRGNSSIFAYYRYRIAKEPAFLDMMTYFESRYEKVLAAKQELAPFINDSTIQQLQVLKGTATKLTAVANESVDYIYTDPPYGSKIQYLDLSVMWNAWLDLPITESDYALEAIEGGELKKTKQEYGDLLAESIREMYRVLKFGRWMSFVFAHKDPAYWHLIVETAEQAGFEYMGAAPQSNDKVSFKKRQNPFTVLNGQLIINFKKVRNPRTIMRAQLGDDISELVLETIEGVIAQNDGAALEEINNELITKGIEYGFLDVLSRKYDDLSPLLEEHFVLDAKAQKYHLPHNSKFKCHIDVALRIKYYLISYLRRMGQQHITPTFSDVVLNIMPLLKNGITPDNQTILKVLEEVAHRVGDEQWRLREGQQLRLFY